MSDIAKVAKRLGDEEPLDVSLPEIGCYSPKSSQANCIRVTIGGITIFFSYTTPVAFITFPDGTVCSENVWSTTTGKHLNWIEPNKANRVPNAEFETRLRNALYKMQAGVR